ncbi:MAG: transaldolase family protein [Anaerolineae bacterium]
MNTSPELVETVKALSTEGCEPRYGELRDAFQANPRWQQLVAAGSRLWLDTGDIDGAAQYWTREFEALTTNNTLLNREVQKGIYDQLIEESAASLREFSDLGRDQLVIEIALVLNARHGLRLVERFDAWVSVELHTDLAHDVERTVWYGRRLYDICPRRFIVKVPLTPEGYLAARKLASHGVRVNFTLGFSARQNLLAASLSEPAYVNVFLGRLNSFVDNNKLGRGENVGERATIASQRAIAELRAEEGVSTQQIAASMREGDQVRKLAGVDVMTMPLSAAGEFLALDMAAEEIVPFAEQKYPTELQVKTARSMLDTLWTVPQAFRDAVSELRRETLDRVTADGLRAFFEARGFGGLFPAWSEVEIEAIASDGKIPDYERWSDRLQEGSVALDALMSKSGLLTFAADQLELDRRIRSHL